MNKETINKLVPKLRFPEFRYCGEWKEKKLGDICEIANGKSNVQDQVENGKYPLFDRSEIVKTSDKYLFDCEAVILPGEGVHFIPKYYVGKFDLHQRAYALKNFKCVGLFVYFSMAAHNKLLTSKAVRSTVLSLRLPILQKFPILLPWNPKEQQKIASCLSSLDDLIIAESQKLEILKNHKKGLMQQLFPAEGKFIPKLRFSEFEDGGKWKEKVLGDIMSITSCKRVHQSDWKNQGIPFYRARDIVVLKNKEVITPLYISEDLYNNNIKLCGQINSGDLLVTGVGTIGVPYLVKNGDKFYFKDGNIIWLKNDNSEITGEFLYLLYESDFVQRQISKMAGVGTVGTYTIDNAKNTVVVFPNDKEKKEQQKIVNCFSFIDILITAQMEKIKALKDHKKGLMQQLFPVIN